MLLVIVNMCDGGGVCDVGCGGESAVEDYDEDGGKVE